MKKKLIMTMLIAIVLLSLSTAFFVQGTLAQFITTDSGYDVVYTAKWGIKTSVTAYSNYSNDDIIEVGIGGSFIVHWEGQPEVVAQVNIEANIEYIGNWVNEFNEPYYPIMWAIVEGESYSEPDEWIIYDDLTTQLTNLATEYTILEDIDYSYTIFWKWVDYELYADSNEQIVTMCNLYMSDEVCYIYSEETQSFTYYTYYIDGASIIEQPEIAIDVNVTVSQVV